jgi:hypothetical protein
MMLQMGASTYKARPLDGKAALVARATRGAAAVRPLREQPAGPAKTRSEENMPFAAAFLNRRCRDRTSDLLLVRDALGLRLVALSRGYGCSSGVPSRRETSRN